MPLKEVMIRVTASRTGRARPDSRFRLAESHSRSSFESVSVGSDLVLAGQASSHELSLGGLSTFGTLVRPALHCRPGIWP